MAPANTAYLPKAIVQAAIGGLPLAAGFAYRYSSWGKRKSICSGFMQKGIEFDPFKIGVIKLLDFSSIP